VTIEEFAGISAARIPTPAEFVAFAVGQGYGFRVAGDKAAIVADRNDPVAVALARMLGREPYRTNVLKLLAEADSPANVERPAPPERAAEPEAFHCDTCEATVYDAEAAARTCNMAGDRRGNNRCPLRESPP
jgi:hypothetical protein